MTSARLTPFAAARRIAPRAALLLILPLLGACVAVTPPPAPRGVFALSPADVVEVSAAVEPIATALCEAETPDQRCDFAFLLDRDPQAPPNAFQTVDRDGRPILIVTLPLIALMETRDELAFVLGHEAGHHIARHIPGQRQSAAAGAQEFGDLARASGADETGIAEATQIGALVASRQYSQRAELEADALGAIIAWRAGFDPVEGAELFSRLAQPSANILASHPPNRARLRQVRQTVRLLESGG